MQAVAVGIFTCNIFTDDVIPKTIGFRRPRQSAPQHLEPHEPVRGAAR